MTGTDFSKSNKNYDEDPFHRQRLSILREGHLAEEFVQVVVSLLELN